MTEMIVTGTAEEDSSTMKAFTQVLDFVNKARDAVIQASSLAKEVAEMRTELNNLKAEIEEAHRKNADFEQQLQYVRSERDTALQHASDWERQYIVATNERDNAKNELESLQGQHVSVVEHRDQLASQLVAERLEIARLRSELEEEKVGHNKLKQQLEAIYSKFLQPQPRSEAGQFQPYEEPKAASSW